MRMAVSLKGVILHALKALNVCSVIFVPFQMTVFRVLFNHWKEFVTHRSKIPEGEDPREHFAEMLRRHRADNKSKKEASERRRMARLSAERKKKEKEEREKKRMEDLARSVNVSKTNRKTNSQLRKVILHLFIYEENKGR